MGFPRLILATDLDDNLPGSGDEDVYQANQFTPTKFPAFTALSRDAHYGIHFCHIRTLLHRQMHLR